MFTTQLMLSSLVLHYHCSIYSVISSWDIGAATAAVYLQNGTSMMGYSVDVLHHSPPVCGLKEEFSLKTLASGSAARFVW